MKIDIIAIGNSRGLRIPKAMLDQCGFEQSADVAVEDGQLVIRPRFEARRGWDEAFRQMADRQDDELIDTPAPAFDDAEWSW